LIYIKEIKITCTLSVILNKETKKKKKIIVHISVVKINRELCVKRKRKKSSQR